MKIHNGMAVINGAVCFVANKNTPGAFFHYGEYYVGQQKLLDVLRGIYEQIVKDFGTGCALYEHAIMKYVNGDAFTLYHLRQRYNIETCGSCNGFKMFAI